MDTKIIIKEEDPLSEDITSQSETVFFTKNVTVKTNSDAVPPDIDCDVTIKKEIKSETPLQDFCSQKGKECRNNYKTDTATEIEKQTLVSDFGSHNEGEFFPEDPVINFEKYNSDREVNNRIDIKGEPWWLKTESSSVYDEIKDGDFNPVNSVRLFTAAVYGDSSNKPPLPSEEPSGDISCKLSWLSADNSEKAISFYNGKNGCGCQSQESGYHKDATCRKACSIKTKKGGTFRAELYF